MPSKQLFSILMALILLTPSLLKVGVYVDFKLRQGYIAEVLCVDRTAPINLCSGACYLDERLKQVEEVPQGAVATTSSEKTELQFFFQEPAGFASLALSTSDNEPPAVPALYYPSTFIDEIFHPPSV